MSAATVATVPARGTIPGPVSRVARLHLVAWPVAMLWPWGILGLSFAMNLLIWGTVSQADEGWTGGLMSIYVVQFIGYVQTYTRGFPFALGMSVTRRAYYAGTWLYAALEAVAFSTVLLALKLVEDATGGWGVSLEFFGVPPVGQDDALLQWLVYVVPFLFGAALGACWGLVMERWGYNGLLTIMAGIIVVLGVAVVVVSRGGWWQELGHWFADQSTAAMLAAWPLVPIAVLAVIGYAVIRRATP